MATNPSKLVHVNALVAAMNDDQDFDFLLLRQQGNVSMPFFFGLIHAFIGSDILCSPRSFGPALILRTFIDNASHLFSAEKGIQNLYKENHNSQDAYCCCTLALYKKRYANKIKLKGDEMFGANANMDEVLDTVRQEIWINTLENNSVLPSRECLRLRGQNLSFQLKVWTQATKPLMEVPDPLTHGWEKTESGFRMIPDSQENIKKQATVFETVMKKCKCKKSQCKNGKCACFKSDQNCSSFCDCENCCNPHAKEVQTPIEDSDSDEETEDEHESDVGEEQFEEDLDMD